MIHVLLALLLNTDAAGTSAASPSTRSAPATPAAAPSPAGDTGRDEYRIGAGDVLDITVIGDQDLSRPSAVVQTNGMVTLPLLGEVAVASLTVSEVKTKLTRLLERDYLVRPQVEVKVREFQSQSVTVLGEVNSPGRKPLRGYTRLLDVLTESGGLTVRASGDVEISRLDGTFPGGAKTLLVRINSGTPTAQDIVSFQIQLRNGDVVRALQKYYVVVEGEVARPARYVLEPDLTVTGLVSMAGGFTRWAKKNELKILRKATPTGEVEVIKVDYNNITKGKKPDVLLEPNDRVVVGRRLF